MTLTRRLLMAGGGSGSFTIGDEWLRIKFNTGNTWSAWYSYDGVYFIQLVNGTSESWTATKVGIYCRTGSTNTSACTIDWIRREA